MPWTTIVLTGGTGTRLGGRDKAQLSLGSRTTLGLILDAIPDEVPVLVAGPPIRTRRSVTFRGEDPARGGPVAGLAAALPAVDTAVTCVLAVDMPWAVALLPGLVSHLSDTGGDVVLPVDADGRRQYLCSAWRTASLRRAVAALDTPRDAPVRALLDDQRVAEWPVPEAVEPDLLDIDDQARLEQARRRAAQPRLDAERPRS